MFLMISRVKGYKNQLALAKVASSSLKGNSKAVFDLICKHGHATTDDIREELGLLSNYSGVVLHRLRKAGAIERVSNERKTHVWGLRYPFFHLSPRKGIVDDHYLNQYQLAFARGIEGFSLWWRSELEAYYNGGIDFAPPSPEQIYPQLKRMGLDAVLKGKMI